MKLLYLVLLIKTIIILNLITTINCNSITSDKLSQHVSNKILYNDDNGNSSIPKLWIFFKSKDIHILRTNNGESSPQFIDINDGKEIKFDDIKSLSGITDGSLSRRLKLNKQTQQQKLIDETDLPVCQQFINEILTCSTDIFKIKLVQRSKWLNSISISFTSTINSEQNISSSSSSSTPQDVKLIIDCIVNKSFVDKVDVVTKFKKETIKHDDIVASSNGNGNVNGENFNKIGSSKFLIKKTTASTNTATTTTNKDKSFYGGTWNGINQVGIDKLANLGYDGYGITILMLDSGFYKAHDAFKQLKIIGEHNFIDGSDNTQGELDDPQNSHGTATLSTVAGYMPGTLIGAAYNASFLLGKTEVVSSESIIEEDYWIAGIEWGEGLGAQIVSSSLGYTQWYNYYDLDAETSHLTRMADFATTKGMVVVVSAGNSGASGIGSPADGKHVIAVGAMVNETGINTGFSSVGPSADGRVKPDIMTLGYKNFVCSYKGKSNYTNMSGTSFACPLAASGIALLMQAHPDWTNHQIYEAVLGSASHSSQPNIYTGFGTFNVFNAYHYKPTDASKTCAELGCSGHGGCCNEKCTCSSDYYGEFCQYQKIQCSTDCTNRHGKCQFDKFGLSTVCVDPNNTLVNSKFDPRDDCPICTDAQFDLCGVCGGNNQCLTNDNGSPCDNNNVNNGNLINLSQCKTIILENNNTNNKLKFVVGLGVGGVAFVCLIVFSALIYKKKKQSNLIWFPFLNGYKDLSGNNSDDGIDICDNTNTQIEFSIEEDH